MINFLKRIRMYFVYKKRMLDKKKKLKKEKPFLYD